MGPGAWKCLKTGLVLMVGSPALGFVIALVVPRGFHRRGSRQRAAHAGLSLGAAEAAASRERDGSAVSPPGSKLVRAQALRGRGSVAWPLAC